MDSAEMIKLLKITALVPLVLAMAILLLFALGETAGGDPSGLGHLIPVVLIGGMMWLGWKRPQWGGIFLLLMSVVATLFFSDALRGPEWLAPFLIMIAPLLLSGLLLLVAAWLERKAT